MTRKRMKKKEEEHFWTAKMAFCIYSKASPRNQISQPPQPFFPTRSPEISLPATGRYSEERQIWTERICLCSAGVKDWICFEVGLVLCVKALYRCKWRMWPRVTFHTLDFLDCRKLAVVTPLLLVGTWAQDNFKTFGLYFLFGFCWDFSLPRID